MAKLIGTSTYRLESPVYIIGNGAMVGKKEADELRRAIIAD